MLLLRITKVVVLGLVLLVSISCTAINTKVGGLLSLDTDLSIEFLVDADVNPDDNNIPSPLIIRMYELKSPKMFKKANFIDLFERDAEVLGADLVTKQRLKHIRPGEVRETNFVLSEETKFVGLFAEFLRYKNSEYKLVIPIAQTNVFSSSADIKLTGNKITFKNIESNTNKKLPDSSFP